MSSSPEQQPTSPTNDRMVHNQSTSSITSTLSVGSVFDSPPHGTSPGQILNPQHASLMTSSTPNSPQIPSRPSSGKLGRGVKKFLRIPQTPTTSQTHPPTLHEDPIEQNKEALFARMLRGSRKIRTFRRTKRRGIDKQYHSDDGYTSDPGILREEEDDETDVDADTVTENRRQQQIRNLERKIVKLRTSLNEEDDAHVSEQDLEILPGIDDKPHRLSLRLPRSSLKTKSQRKKLENWESQLRLLQEGALPESRYTALRERIGGGLRGMSLGLRGRLTFKRPKRFTISGSNPDEEAIDDDEDDETFPEDDISQTAEGVLHVETEGFTNGTELLPMLKLKEAVDVIRHNSEDCLQENQKLREEIEIQKEQVEGLQEHINAVYMKLEQEKERIERLEGQVNDVTELHQHEVGELRAQIGQMESMTMSKNQDLEDAMEACQSKVERLDAFVHRLIDSGDRPTSHIVRKPVANLLSFGLMVFAMLLKLISFVRTKVGLVITLIVIFIAIIVYFIYNR